MCIRDRPGYGPEIIMQNRFIQPKTSVIIETHKKRRIKNKKLNETIMYKIVSYIIQRHTEIS